MTPSKIYSHLSSRTPPLKNYQIKTVNDVLALRNIGIDLGGEQIFRKMMDAIQQPTLAGSMAVPVQFLQAWVPGYALVMTQARNIDLLTGITTIGEWESEEIVWTLLETTGAAQLYGDYTNVPLSNWNPAFERRTVLRFEQGMLVTRLEEKRAGHINIQTANIKRLAAGNALEISRNRIGFYGFNNGLGRTFGFLNDPNLPAYITVPVGVSGFTEWAKKTYLEITADIRSMVSGLRTQSGDQINPTKVDMILAVATSAVDFLTVTDATGLTSVRKWLNDTFPRIRVESAPELDNASGGENVAYLYAEKVPDNGTDNGRTFDQGVPTKFLTLGVEQKAKGYLEDFGNASAGTICLRPFAVYRVNGI